jgi:hypothetical protein
MLHAFDLLEFDGKDLRPLPLSERKAKLAKLLARVPAGIVYNEQTDEDGAVVFRHACKMGLEGIVSKRITLSLRAISGLDQGEEPGRPGDAAGARGAMVISVDLEQFLAPADLIPAGPLVLAHRPISAMQLVRANPPLPACRLIPARQLVPALLFGQRATAAPRQADLF